MTTLQTRNTAPRNTDKRYPIVTPPAQDTASEVNEFGIVPSDFYNESGIFCNQKYADREAKKYNPKVWYLRYPNLPKGELGEAITQGIEIARQFVSESHNDHNFQSVANWHIQDAVSKLQYEVHQRGRAEREAAREAEEARKRWHESTPLGTALRNTGHKLVDNIRAIDGRYQKRGITWQSLRELAPTPPGYSDLAGDIERDNRGFGREPQYREERMQNNWGRSRAIVYEVNPDSSSTDGRVYR
jgi:hypothetical protein